MLQPQIAHAAANAVALQKTQSPHDNSVNQAIRQKAIEFGCSCLEAGKTSQAIACFLTVLDISEDWICRFWLGHAYLAAQMIPNARHQFLYIVDRCPRADLRTAARQMLASVD